MLKTFKSVFTLVGLEFAPMTAIYDAENGVHTFSDPTRGISSIGIERRD